MTWQPIETAPWDGGDVLVMCKYDDGEGGIETEVWVDWRAGPYEWPVYGTRIDIPAPPQMWHPLPDLPQ